MQISVFHTAKEDRVAHVDEVIGLDWNELPLIVTKFAWAPATFNNGHRSIADFEQMQLFVCDIDGGCTIEEATKIFAPYRCIIGTSKSHQKEKVKKHSGIRVPPCDRFRVILELESPITSDLDFKATWFEVQKLCPAIDPSCKDSARFYFPCQEIVAQWDGRTIPVTKYVPKSTTATNPSLPTGARLTPSKRTLKFLVEGAPEGQWHAELTAACYDLKQQRWSQEDATKKFEQITGHLDEHDEGVIDDVFNNRDPRHLPRIEINEADKQMILKCHLIMDTRKDSGDYTFLDQSCGEVRDIDIRRAAAILGKKAWSDYLQTNQINARYTFNPYGQPLTFDPKTNTRIYNTYRPPAWRHRNYWFNEPIKKLDEIPTLFDQYFTHITGGHLESKEYLLDWIANSLHRRNFTILTAIGIQGAGKGLLATGILRNLHGASNYYYGRDELFKNKFNAQLLNRTLVNVDEIHLQEKEEIDKLKGVINNEIEIEGKGENARNVDNFASFYITSNHLDAISIEPGDRRYSVIQLTNTKFDKTELFKHLNYFMSEETVGELARYLWYRPITHDMMTPFRSQRYEEVRTAGLKDWEIFFLEDFCEAHRGQRHPIRFVLDEIKEGAELKSLGRPSLEKLQKRFPERFQIIKDPQQRGKRLVVITGP